jgi:zinc protease
VGKFGIATLMADLMDQGAGSRDARLISATADALGASITVRTDRVSTSVQIRSTGANLDSVLALLADVAVRPTFPDGAVQLFRGRLVGTLRGLAGGASNVAAVGLSRLIFGAEHPDGQSSLGVAEDVESITVDDLAAFHRSTFQPDRARLIVVGDADAAEILPKLEAALGSKWLAGQPVRPPTPTRHSAASCVLVVHRPGAVQSTLRAVAALPARSDDFAAIEVLNMVLGGSGTSRLGRSLTDRLGYTYEVRSLVEWRPETSLFITFADVSSASTAPALAEMQRLLHSASSAVTPDELAAAKNQLGNAMPQRFMTAAGVSAAIGELFLLRSPRDFHDTYLARIDAVASKDVLAAARSYLTPDRLRYVVVGDTAVFLKALRMLGIGPIDVVGSDALLPRNRR